MEGKIKLLHVTAGGLGNDGVSNVIFSIVESLNKYIDFNCIVFNFRGKREREFNKYGKIYSIYGYTNTVYEKIFRPVIFTYSIWRICRREKFDIIHCHNDFDQGFCLLGAYLAGVKVRIAHSHNSVTPQKRSFIKRTYNKICAYLINHFATNRVACTKMAGELLFKNYEVQVIYNSIDLDRFKWPLREKNDEIKFVHVGRYAYPKNQLFALKVFYYLHQKFPKSVFSLVGHGRDESKIKEEIKNLGLDNCVKMFSSLPEDIPQIFSNSDYMIFPSEYEGFGIVLLEAQASGCRCFVSDSVPRDSDVGLLTFYSLKDGPEYWAECIAKHIFSNSDIETKNNVLSNLNQFRKEEIAKQYFDLYESIKK